MTAVYNEARDQMFALFEAAWQANAPAIATYEPEIRWQGRERQEVPASDQFWCRVSAQSVSETQSTLSDCVEEPGRKRYTSSGLIFVQLFGPKEEEDYEKLEQLAIVARNAFRGKTTPGKVWFRNARINTIPEEVDFYRLNAVAEYEYDEVG